MQENITIASKSSNKLATMLLAGAAIAATTCPVLFHENITDVAKNVKHMAQQTASAINQLGNPASYGRMIP